MCGLWFKSGGSSGSLASCGHLTCVADIYALVALQLVISDAKAAGLSESDKKTFSSAELGEELPDELPAADVHDFGNKLWEVVTLTHSLLTFFERSTVRKAALQAQLIKMNLSPLAIIRPNETRWDGEYDMLHRTRKLWPAIKLLTRQTMDMMGADKAKAWSKFLEQRSRLIVWYDANEYGRVPVSDVLLVLGRIKSFSMRMQAAAESTLSQVPGALRELAREWRLDSLDASQQPPHQKGRAVLCEEARDIARALKSKLEERKLRMDIPLARLAELLDPRTSVALVRETKASALVDEGLEYLKAYAVRIVPPVQHVVTAASALPAHLLQSLAAQTGKQVAQSTAITAKRHPIDDELHHWMEHMFSHGGVDAPTFYKSLSATCPIICAIARRVLAVPASSAASERAFSRAGAYNRGTCGFCCPAGLPCPHTRGSLAHCLPAYVTAGYFLTPERLCMHPNTLDAMMFLSDVYKPYKPSVKVKQSRADAAELSASTTAGFSSTQPSVGAAGGAGGASSSSSSVVAGFGPLGSYFSARPVVAAAPAAGGAGAAAAGGSSTSEAASPTIVDGTESDDEIDNAAGLND